MRTELKFCLIMTLALMVAWLLVPPIAPAAGIQATKHDFTQATGTGSIKDAGTNATMCNTCHYPHHTAADSDAAVQPLWNHTLQTTTYTWSPASTIAGTPLPTSVGASVTRACLSCHDGSVAVGDLIKGTDWDAVSKVSGAYKLTASGGTADLTGNHPVAIPYPDQSGAIYNSITTKATVAEFVASPSTVRIYGSTAGAKGIECGSCHDPHKGDTSPGKFLRASQSALCTYCHIK